MPDNSSPNRLSLFGAIGSGVASYGFIFLTASALGRAFCIVITCCLTASAVMVAREIKRSGEADGAITIAVVRFLTGDSGVIRGDVLVVATFISLIVGLSVFRNVLWVQVLVVLIAARYVGVWLLVYYRNPHARVATRKPGRH